MRRSITFVLLAVALGGCGSVHERNACSVSPDCPAGQYCARTGDGNVCWPDALPPTIATVTVSCQAPAQDGSCSRDGVLRVQATITDDVEVLGAEAALDVGGGAVPLARTSGNVWAADVPLRTLPFGHFEHAVVTTVTARDGARNATSLEPGVATTVTRRRFARPLDTGVFSLGHPAVMQDGTVVTAGTNGKVYFVPWDGVGVHSAVVVGTGAITAAPLALGSSVWIGSEDSRVYELIDDPGWQAWPRTDDTGGPVRGSLALTADERIISVSESGLVYATTSTSYRTSTPLSALTYGAVVDGSSIIVASGSSIRRLTLALGVPAVDMAFSSGLGSWVAGPLATAAGIFATASNGAEGFVKRVSLSGGDPEHVATTAIPSGGVVGLADSSLLVPEQTKTVSRWTSLGAPFPGWQKPDLGGATRTPLVLAAAVPFLVPTAKGALHALRADGTIAWSGQLSAGTASLQPGNIYTPPGQPPGEELSTAYFAGSDGVLHAVIVDGKLDGSAPWPKAFHDPRNTNRAGAQP